MLTEQPTWLKSTSRTSVKEIGARLGFANSRSLTPILWSPHGDSGLPALSTGPAVAGSAFSAIPILALRQPTPSCGTLWFGGWRDAEFGDTWMFEVVGLFKGSPAGANSMKTAAGNHGSGDGMAEPKERRRYPRINYPMPLTVRLGDLEFETVVKDLSAGGVSSCLPTQISTGEELGLAIEFSLAGSRPELAPKVSARGIVTRVRKMGDGTCEFAARLTSYRFA